MRHELCKLSDIPAEGSILVPFFGREVHVWRDSTGRVRAAANACLHFGGPLECRDGRLTCPWHGASFDMDSGARVEGPGPKDARLMFLSTRVDADALFYVWGERPMSDLTLISHPLCPYVQRAAIALHEKGLPFTRIDIDLANKPGWFLAISPLGKTPVLKVVEAPIFESAVILEYLEDTTTPPLHPADALDRARHRGWIEVASAVLNDIGALYSAPDEPAFRDRAAALQRPFQQIEASLAEGPWFGGAAFSLVDAALAPVFRYFDVFDRLGDFGTLGGLPRVAAWRAALAARPSVRAAAPSDYEARLMAFLKARASHLGGLARQGAIPA